MTIYVKVYVGAAEAVKLGKSEHGAINVEINPADLTQEQRDEVARMRFDNGAFHWSYPTGGPIYGEATIDQALDLIASHRDYRETEERRKIEAKRRDEKEYERRVRDWIEMDIADITGSSRKTPPTYYGVDPKSLPEGLALALAEKNRQVQEANDRIKADDDRRRREREEQEKQAAADKEKRLDQFLAEHGSEMDIIKRERGLLQEGAVTNMVRDHIFAKISDLLPLDRYERVKLTTYQTVESADEINVSDDEMAMILDTEKLLAEHSPCVTVRRHTITEHNDYDSSIVRRSMLVSVDWHGTKLSREFQISGCAQ